MGDLINGIVSWYMDNLGYGTLFLCMLIESTFLPFPSEIIIPPAAWLAAEGRMDPFLIVLIATLGSLAGAAINYILSVSLGRTVIHSLARTRFARMIHAGEENVIKAEQYFVKNGNSATFVGRLIPGIRHLISIPAGLARMPIASFALFTGLGALLWSAILCALGYAIHSQKTLLEPYYHVITIVALALGALFVAYLVLRAILKRRAARTQENTANPS